ncbi:hypothetical protein CYLTODRAFT_493892 [Cylindrobasidium torrendii FP15055 ss-10]|uniref:Serine/threonine-protein kinase Tel1 n=1 Tax=Cylindrobasidium torrendii FP15055 ss-10 TaxID=1314674 RepID=A0A0D7B1S4_9AGAR|nr:hypothetical protein CYLTODRAFT_493892 [Cylindrobasidium torrendii FP15055 ss-10]
MARSVQSILDSLHSDKVKERIEGRKLVEDALVSPAAVQRFHDHCMNTSGKSPWKPLLQAVLICLRTEIKYATQKKSLAAEGKLQECAKTFALVVESGSQWITSAATKLITHEVVSVLFERSHRQICQPIRLTLLGTLNTFLQVPRHFDHIPTEHWTAIAQYAFNIVLNDPLDLTFLDSYRMDDGVEDRADKEEEEPEDEEDDGLRTPGPRKRRFKDSTPSRSSTRRQIASPSDVQRKSIELLVTLFRLPSANFHVLPRPRRPTKDGIVEEEEDEDHIALAIMDRLSAYLEVHPPESSLTYNYLELLLAVLSHVSLNYSNAVTEYTARSWRRLTALRNTKGDFVKECMVSVLSTLFPFFMAAVDKDRNKWIDTVQRSWDDIQRSGNAKWSSLSFDALRLEFTSVGYHDLDDDGAFVAGSFRAGHNFSRSSAFAWMSLKFHAQFAVKLYELCDSATTYGARSTKKLKLDVNHRDPINRTRHALAMNPLDSSPSRIYELQLLLFIIDFYWFSLHRDLQSKITEALTGIITSNVSDMQVLSWTCMCVAGVVQANRKASSKCLPPLQPQGQRDLATMWDSIWANTVRRASVTNVSRAACHVARALLLPVETHTSYFSSPRLATTRILTDIEAFMKDLDIQGPAYPFDSVCLFLAQCLQLASHDMRLYRMQLEDKVLSWFVECWKLNRTAAGSLPGHNARDVLRLLESISGVARGSDVLCSCIIPRCDIVDTVEDSHQTAVIREFLLYASLPELVPQRTNKVSAEFPRVGQTLADPSHRQRRLSIFMISTLESMLEMWAHTDKVVNYSVVSVRRALDMAVVILAYQGLLVYNGVRGEKVVFQTAGKVIALLLQITRRCQWTSTERILALSAMEPLLSSAPRATDREPFSAFVTPGLLSGIRADMIRDVVQDDSQAPNRRQAARMELQRIVWREVEASHLDEMKDAIKAILQGVCNGQAPVEIDGTPAPMDVDDGFGTIRMASTQAGQVTQQGAEEASPGRDVVYLCLSFLTRVPLLQSSTALPTRAGDLIDTVLSAEPDVFVALAPALFEQFREKSLHPGTDALHKIVSKIYELVGGYHFNQDMSFHLLALNFLESVFVTWRTLQPKPVETQDLFKMIQWLADYARPWRVRDASLKLFDIFMVEDPDLVSWPEAEEDDADEDKLKAPDALAARLNSDADIRVRFRGGPCSAHQLAFAHARGGDSDKTYMAMLDSLPRQLENFEHGVTRLLTLANIAITSSAVRRGSYWNTIELVMVKSLHQQAYERRLSALLGRVSEALGFPSPKSMFCVHASHLANAFLAQSIEGISEIAPSVVGYTERKQLARDAFSLFTPIYLSAVDPEEEDKNMPERGRIAYSAHCAVLGQDEDEGILECFADIVASTMVVIALNDFNKAHAELLARTRTNSEDFERLMRLRVDGVCARILSCCKDWDTDTIGSMFNKLDPDSNSLHPCNEAIQFGRLVQDRGTRKAPLHETMQPRGNVLGIFQSLEFLKACNYLQPEHNAQPKHDDALTYHVLQHLFASVEREIQVNEQLRIINGICIWVAYRFDSFNNPTVLITLLRNCASLLHQPDLVGETRAMLKWGFRQYRCLKSTDSRFPDILIRISRICSDYASASNPDWQALGEDLGVWLDEETVEIAKHAELEAQVLLALPAWSRPLSDELATLYAKVETTSLSSTLANPGISANKFHVVGRLRETAMGEFGYLDSAEENFWRLKACIPPRGQLLREDVDAFADLLMWNKGGIDAFASNLPKSTKTKELSAPTILVMLLLATVEGTDFERRDLAYRTLRMIGPQIAVPRTTEQGDELVLLKEYTLPPTSVPGRTLKELDVPSLTALSSSFAVWVRSIGSLLSAILGQVDGFYAQLTDIIDKDVLFAQEALPILVQVLLQSQAADRDEYDEQTVILSNYFTLVLSAEAADVRCLRAIIDVVLHLRNLPHPVIKNDQLGHDKWLCVDFILLAHSAIKVGAYTTALLFIELAYEHKRRTDPDPVAVETAMYDIYSNIDEPDGFYGIKPSNLSEFLLNQFRHEGQWDKALRFHGAAIEAGNRQPRQVEGLLKSFSAFGFNTLATITAQSSLLLNEQSEMAYALGWRTGTWDIPDNGQDTSDGSLYLALRAIHVERDGRMSAGTLQECLFREMERLRNLGSENVKQIREVIRNLLCLRQLSVWSQSPYTQLVASKERSLDPWKEFVQLDPGFEFSLAESIMATRLSILKSVQRREDSCKIGNMSTPFSVTLSDLEQQSLLAISRLARSEGQHQVALNAVIRAQSLGTSASFEVDDEFASVLWAQKEERRAIDHLIQLRDRSPAARSHLAAINARLGEWSASACLDKPSAIWTNFFEPARLSAGHTDQDMSADEMAAVYFSCAAFAEERYQDITRSADHVRRKFYMTRRQNDIDQLNLTTRERALASKLLESDRRMYDREESERIMFLRHGLELYAKCMEISDVYDGEAPLYLISLWMANFEQSEIENELPTALSRVPSRKFVFLIHQLCARLTMQQSVHQMALRAILERMCTEHPFHSLSEIFCLRSGNAGRGNQNRKVDSASDRALAANLIFQKLKGNPKLVKWIADTDILCDASVQFATWPISKNDKYKGNKIFDAPSGYKIRKISRGGRVSLDIPPLTAHVPIERELLYNDIPRIDHYEATFTTAGGMNLPKILACHDHRGRRYKQLFKGEGSDDPRQDAVMEQVFELVNVVLAKDRETRKRDLHLRCYKIVPLSTAAGVLEFVDETTTMKAWIDTASKNHRRKNQLASGAANVQFRSFYEAGAKGNPPKLLGEFNRLRALSPPVMRHWFTEKNKLPIAWYKTRLNYTRSVATTSIVGWMVGLGDRHGGNILIDNTSSELVHIDLGIAFDSGKILPVPERVPFRMTDNIVDGMGVSKTEGVFQRCAEETLRVLRERRRVFMTILEVFRHDPLYSWVANDYRAMKAQGDDVTPLGMEDVAQRHLGINITMAQGTAAEEADRALGDFNARLDPSLSVSATVSGLVAEAMAPENLSLMYYGWGPLI